MVFDYCILSLFERCGSERRGSWIGRKPACMANRFYGALALCIRIALRIETLSLNNVLINNDGRCVVVDLGLAECASTLVLDRAATTLYYRAREACFPEARQSTQQCRMGTHIFATTQGDDAKDVKALL